jgi:O-antigen/teichoic acid export membrane protein
VLKTFLKDTALYAIGVFAIRLINFVLMPFLTRKLSPADYGVITLILTISPIVLYVITLQISQALPKYCSNNPDISLKKEYISTGFFFVILVYLFFYFAAISIPNLSQIVLGTLHYQDEMSLGLINICLFGIFTYLETQLRWDQKTLQYTLTSVFMMLASLGLIIGFIFLNMGLKGYFIGSAIGQLFGCLLAYYYGKDNYRPVFSKRLLAQMLSFTGPLTISAAAGYIFANMNQWLLRFFCDLNTVGIYGVASRFSSIISVIFGCVALSITPRIYADYQKKEMPGFISFLFRLSFLISLWGSAIFIVFSQEILSMAVGQAFLDAGKYIPLVLLSYAFTSFYIFTPGQFIHGKTKEMAVVNIVASAVNFLIALILIQKFFIFGAVVGLFAGSCIQLGLNIFFSQKYYPIDFKLPRVVVSLILFLIFYTCIKSTVFLLLVFLIMTSILLLERRDFLLLKGAV